jgi:hypothetical protein
VADSQNGQLMPLYFFDIDDGQGVRLDEEGADLAGLHEAREEAVHALFDLGRDLRPAPDRCDFTIKVRDEEGTYFCSISLSLEAHWLAVEHQAREIREAG